MILCSLRQTWLWTHFGAGGAYGTLNDAEHGRKYFIYKQYADISKYGWCPKGNKQTDSQSDGQPLIESVSVEWSKEWIITTTATFVINVLVNGDNNNNKNNSNSNSNSNKTTSRGGIKCIHIAPAIRRNIVQIKWILYQKVFTSVFLYAFMFLLLVCLFILHSSTVRHHTTDSNSSSTSNNLNINIETRTSTRTSSLCCCYTFIIHDSRSNNNFLLHPVKGE